MLIHRFRSVYRGYAIVFSVLRSVYISLFLFQGSSNVNKKKKKFRCGLCQIYAQCIFAEYRPYYQTARISMSDVKVVLCLTKHYAINPLKPELNPI